MTRFAFLCINLFLVVAAKNVTNSNSTLLSDDVLQVKVLFSGVYDLVETNDTGVLMKTTQYLEEHTTEEVEYFGALLESRYDMLEEKFKLHYGDLCKMFFSQVLVVGFVMIFLLAAVVYYLLYPCIHENSTKGGDLKDLLNGTYRKDQELGQQIREIYRLVAKKNEFGNLKAKFVHLQVIKKLEKEYSEKVIIEGSLDGTSTAKFRPLSNQLALEPDEPVENPTQPSHTPSSRPKSPYKSIKNNSTPLPNVPQRTPELTKTQSSRPTVSRSSKTKEKKKNAKSKRPKTKQIKTPASTPTAGAKTPQNKTNKTQANSVKSHGKKPETTNSTKSTEKS